MSMERFFTREAATAGKRIPLRTPDGKLTEEWLQVRSRLCDAFVAAQREAVQLVAATDEAKRIGVAHDAKIKVLSVLVCGWSFDKECTQEAVIAFLREAPQIAEQINSFAGDDEAFFASGSDNFTNTSEPKSS